MQESKADSSSGSELLANNLVSVRGHPDGRNAERILAPQPATRLWLFFLIEKKHLFCLKPSHLKLLSST